MHIHPYFDQVRQPLLKVLRIAEDHVPFYRDVFGHSKIDLKKVVTSYEEFQRIPFLRKADIVASAERLINSTSCMKEIVWESTSGTTGTPVRIGRLPWERAQAALDIWRWRRRHYGINGSSRMIYFTSLYKYNMQIPKETTRRQGNILLFSEIHLSDRHLEGYVRLIRDFRPEWISVTPTVLTVFKDFLVRRQIELPQTIRYIELLGENSSRH